MAKSPPLNIKVERTIAADPAVIYDLVSDITRMGEWSPEATEANWLDGASTATPGAKFNGKNVLGPNKWSTKSTVTTADRGQIFEFAVAGKSGPTWRYEFHPHPTGTRVVESVVQDRRSPLFIRLLQRRAGVSDRAAVVREGMTTTLERLDAAAASPGAASPTSVPTTSNLSNTNHA